MPVNVEIPNIESAAPARRRAMPPWIVPAIALLLMVGAIVITEVVRKGYTDFLSVENLRNILYDWSPRGIRALGMTFVIILGGIDLSVGSLIAFLGAVSILLINILLRHALPDGLAVLVALALVLLTGLMVGLVNGLLVTRGRLAPFIATLGGFAAYRSLAVAMADGGTFNCQSASWLGVLGGGTHGIPIPGTNIAARMAAPIALTLPWPVVTFAILTILAWVALNRTRFGRYVTAIGSNERSAVYSAVPVERVKLAAYALLGVCTALAAVFVASQQKSISSGSDGQLYELDVIAAVVIGGTRMRGGSGTIVGTLIGVFLLGIIGNMLGLLQVSPHLQGLVKGIIIVGAVLLQRSERL